MSLNQPPESGQSPGCDPKQNKRNSGLFGFLKWFNKPSSRESIDTPNSSDSCDSLSSIQSNGTVASFSFVPPSAYNPQTTEKCIAPTPETDTYRARLKQRDRRREHDKNTTLRKKYNLFFSRDTILKTVTTTKKIEDEENSKSLPLMMTRTSDQQSEHRRTNSESSKTKKAGAYLHVKGKRRAPQPPTSGNNTMSLRRKKRLAPAPPPADPDVIANDSLKLDHGILRPAKENGSGGVAEEGAAVRTSVVLELEGGAVASPRPWYKRTSYKPAPGTTPETVNIVPNDTTNKKEEKRKSGMSFLTNISELDREASEIIRNKNSNSAGVEEMPQFMRPKDEPKDNWPPPNKRRSAKDLIAKFNAITNVTKATVFGVSGNTRRDYFSKSKSTEERKQENLLEIHKKRIEEIDKKMNPLMKSESASAIRVTKEPTPKPERKNWKCPKCNLENDYWRIICHVCSAIKPYFDDFSSTKTSNEDLNKPKIGGISNLGENPLERSKTQIGFSALATYNQKKKIEKSISVEEDNSTTKVEEREKLKKMLIEMKNSLPKRKSNILMKQNSRTSVIVENPENDIDKSDDKEEQDKKEEEIEEKKEVEEEKSASIIVATSETIYENIKVKKSDSPKPVKVSSSAQTNAAAHRDDKTSFELMRPKDFENIYTDANNQSPAKIYANLARNDELSLFFNMPKNFNQIKTRLSQNENKDTIEINRLLRRLETAIAKGELTEAAIYAKELAQLKVNCSVIRQKSVNTKKKQGFTVEMYVEDKISHRGPFSIEVTETQTVAELKLQVEQEFEIPVNVQRWILGKELATDDNATLKDHKITTEKCPVFLYLVAPESKTNGINVGKPEEIASSSKIKADNAPKIVDAIPKSTPGPSQLQKNTTIIDEVKNLKPKEAIVKITKIESPKIVPKKEDNLLLGKTEETKNKIDLSAKNKTEPVNNNGAEPKKDLIKTKTEVPIKKEDPKTNGIPKQSPELKKPIPKAEPEDDTFLDYDTKTLKPPKEWECHLCTLLNPLSSNICAVCATIRPQQNPKKPKKQAPQRPSSPQTYMQLVSLDNKDLVETIEPFECVVCFTEVAPGKGVTLRECLHQFCKLCLAHTIQYTEDAEVKCPYRDNDYSCNIAIQDREIKALVTPQVYDSYLAKSVKEAENKMGKSFHCKTPDCGGWCVFEDNVNEFRCPVCRRINCLTCQAIHTGLNCKQYQEKINQESEVDDDAKRTKEMVDEMVKKGEALTCPTCQVILMKKWGCDWVRCSMCKTEICWVTRGPRWGPAGKGDTSGGCQCGVNGVKCHPQCSYCH